MFDYGMSKLMHRHGNDWVLMTESGDHGPADHDPERSWRGHVTVYRCSSCEEEIAVEAPGEESLKVGAENR